MRHCRARSRRRWTAAFLLLAVLSVAAISPSSAQITFFDVSAAANVDRTGESYGASWGDFNGDGYPDLFASNHRERPSLYLNLGNGTFFDTAMQVLIFRNRPTSDTHGGSWADIDNDGDQDLLVSSGTGNLSQLLINENQRMVDRTVERGLTTSNLGGRLPVWLDYDDDKLVDFVMTQYGGIAKLYRQGPVGHFKETTADAKLLCVRFHYGQLLDVTNDGRLDFVCPSEARFPQRIYNTNPLPWNKVYDSTNPAPFLPLVPQAIDSVLADFNNDGRMDLFVLGNAQLRPSGATQGKSTQVEAQLAGGTKGFRFVTDGKVTVWADWNKILDPTRPQPRIYIGANGWHPAAVPFTLDPADPSVRGMPPAPARDEQVPLMQVGYDAVKKQWTLLIQTRLTETSKNNFSEAYVVVDSTGPVSGLSNLGLWPSDKPGRPTLLTNHSGGFVDETVRAGLDGAVQCVSAVAGDFDNDMDQDLYLACRGASSNLANILYENVGDGKFQRVAGAGGAEGPIGAAMASGAGTADTVVVADYNVDGYLDLFVNNGFNLRPLRFGGVNKLYRNGGGSRHWIEVDLVAKQSERDATGARVYAMAGGVTQMRTQNGAYHRWSQDSRRSHFGLGGATTVDLRVEWPSGAVQTFSKVAADRLYRITEGNGIAPVAVGVAPVYQCGPPRINSAVDKGIFLWRDCPSGEWRMKVAAGGGSVVHAGTITSTAPYVSVKPMGLTAADKLDYKTNPKQIVFRFDTRLKAIDGVNFLPADGASACIRIDQPAGARIYFGPFRKLLQPPFDLETQEPCN